MVHRGPIPVPIEERFWPKVRKSDGCWEWTGARVQGYGVIGIRGSKVGRAHRVSWEMHYGPIPDGMFVCHRCDNPPCVRPDHLFLGSNADNMRDAANKDRTAQGEAWRDAARLRAPRGDGHWNAKLTEEQAADIRTSTARGTDLAREYGVSQATISSIRRGHRRVPI